jgi:hypothetical protein
MEVGRYVIRRESDGDEGGSTEDGAGRCDGEDQQWDLASGWSGGAGEPKVHFIATWGPRFASVSVNESRRAAMRRLPCDESELVSPSCISRYRSCTPFS